MRVFMLGWEFPPYISGGLGTACYGLTRALSRQETHITFVLPKAVCTERPDSPRHLFLMSPQMRRTSKVTVSAAHRDPYALTDPILSGFTNVEFKTVPAGFNNPYTTTPSTTIRSEHKHTGDQSLSNPLLLRQPKRPANLAYAGNLVAESTKYADLCLGLARSQSFDLVHAHDWLTFPAGIAVAATTGKPLIVHIHSTEFDRSGQNIQQSIYDIERRGAHAAIRVIAVSELTKSILIKRYKVNPTKIDVVYNGIGDGHLIPVAQATSNPIESGDKIVLFLGRITMQKGPEYFITAAKKVLQKFQGVTFVMAGHGDKADQVTQLADQHGISHKILFTGFLRGAEVDQIFRIADAYVMPSVSEPFGMSALEAISHDVPTIISKQSGVSEVLTHTLKVDFWDTDEIANKILAVLRHPPLAKTLRSHADQEIRSLTWDQAASKCRRVYETAMSTVPS